MGYELVREKKSDCGCKVERYEHDFWSSSSHESITRCPKHKKEHEEEQKLAEERRRQEEEKRNALLKEKRNSLIKELKRIANETNDRVFLSVIVPNSYSRYQLIDSLKYDGMGPSINLEKVKNRWMCNKEATLFYIANKNKLWTL